MRALTVTKKNAKIAIRTEAMARTGSDSRYPSTPGVSVSSKRTAPRTVAMTLNGSSRSYRSGAAAPAPVAIRLSPSLNDCTIIGIERISVMIPPVATAPAPM